MISPASIDDAARAAALLRAVFEDRLSTVRGLRYRMSTLGPEDGMGFWKAESDGDLVGWAYAGIDTSAPTTTAGFGSITVHPAHRRQGVGSMLWEAVSAHVDEIGVKRLVASGEADSDSMAFAASRGFSLASSQTSMAVDPRTIVPPASLPAGVEVRPMRSFDDDPEPVYDVDLETMLDEPGPNDVSGTTYEHWRRHLWDAPDCDHDLSLVALVDGQIAGTTFLFTDLESGRALNAGTGVARAFRGRGLGLLLKQHSLAAAARDGIVRVITQNDDTNAPMVAINARLGYQPFSSGHSWVLENTGAGGSPILVGDG
jgi:GNAT superfamily N-acetyltransferase